MSESMRLTIEEWACEQGFDVKDEQVTELVDAIEVCSEINSMSRMFQSNTKTEKDKEIDNLRKKIETLESFISLKGYSIDVRSSVIVEHGEEEISSSHVASRATYHSF